MAPTAVHAEGHPDDGSEMVFIADVGATTLTPSTPQHVSQDLKGDGFVVTMTVAEDQTIIEREIELVREPASTQLGDEPATFTATTTGEVTLTWLDPSGGEVDWVVSRDGERVGTTRASTYTDVRPVTDAVSEYRIEGSRRLVIDGKSATQPFLILLDVPRVDQSLIGERFDSTSRAAAENTDVLAQKFSLVIIDQELNTFIPDYAINGPFNIPGCFQAWALKPGTLLRFAGDNRSFAGPSIESPSVRTAIEARYSFQGPGQEWAAFGTRTSGTRLIDSSGKTVVQKNASLGGIKQLGGVAGTFAAGSPPGTTKHQTRCVLLQIPLTTR